ncbi:MAG: hypothetical protein KF772_06000 [Cryobacterium sp.]|nr:hypothetical protein [Cryobacterium sp.]MBX3116812.1 hypothetical protein [Cryobacterium sp.]
MQFDTSQLPWGLAILFFVIWAVASVVFILIAIWIQYAIIWHAVRRGMREFYGHQAPAAPAAPPAPPAQ